MAIRLQAGWTFGSTVSSAEVTVTEATGSLDFDILCNSSGIQYNDNGGGGNTVFDADTRWAHEAMSSILGTGNYEAFGAALASALDDASSAHGNGWSYTVNFNASNATYAISAAEGSTALTFTGTPGTEMRQILGFTANQASAAGHTSNARPFYMVVPFLDDKSRVSGDYEPPGLIGGAIAANGVHYSIHPQSLPKFYDFSLEFEMDAASTVGGNGTAVFSKDATSTVPWSWEHFFQHVRSSEPFLSVDDNESIVHYLRPQAAHFDPTRRQVDWDKFDIRLETYNRGRL